MRKLDSTLLRGPTASLIVLWLAGLGVFFFGLRIPSLALVWTTVVVVAAAGMLIGSLVNRARLGRSFRWLIGESSPSASKTPAPARPPSHGSGPGRGLGLGRIVVAVAGVGDIGSRVAVALVQSSVGRLAVADIDVVERANVGQSAFRAVDIGTSKVAAVERLCRDIEPDLEIRYCESDLRRVSDLELGMWIGGASLLILSVDDPVALLRLHDQFYSRIPTVSSGIHGGGASGHVVYTLPRQTACLRCGLAIRGASDLVQIHGNNASPEDVQRIAAETASIALALLDPDRSAQLPLSRNALFITSRQVDGIRSSDGRWLPVERRPDCRVCGGGRGM